MTVTVWILGDQLLATHPALVAAEQIAGGRAGARVVLVESRGRQRKLPYQRKKLVLLLSAMRHYADELRAAGYTVDVMQADSVAAGLAAHAAAHPPQQVFSMAAAEYGGRQWQQTHLAQVMAAPVTLLCGSLLPRKLNSGGRRVNCSMISLTSHCCFMDLSPVGVNSVAHLWAERKIIEPR